MRKGRDGGKRGEKKREEKKNGGKKREKTDENSGHYVIASSRPPERRPPERRPLEHRTLVPKIFVRREKNIKLHLNPTPTHPLLHITNICCPVIMECLIFYFEDYPYEH